MAEDSKDRTIDLLVDKWVRIAEKDYLTAQQLFDSEIIITETVCFHCQQAVEKYLKAFLVKHQIEFTKTHNIMSLINLCSMKDASFKNSLFEADILTDYAVEIRYPDDWYEPSIEETKEALEITERAKQFISGKLYR